MEEENKITEETANTEAAAAELPAPEAVTEQSPATEPEKVVEAEKAPAKEPEKVVEAEKAPAKEPVKKAEVNKTKGGKYDDYTDHDLLVEGRFHFSNCGRYS